MHETGPLNKGEAAARGLEAPRRRVTDRVYQSWPLAIWSGAANACLTTGSTVHREKGGSHELALPTAITVFDGNYRQRNDDVQLSLFGRPLGAFSFRRASPPIQQSKLNQKETQVSNTSTRGASA